MLRDADMTGYVPFHVRSGRALSDTLERNNRDIVLAFFPQANVRSSGLNVLGDFPAIVDDISVVPRIWERQGEWGHTVVILERADAERILSRERSHIAETFAPNRIIVDLGANVVRDGPPNTYVSLRVSATSANRTYTSEVYKVRAVQQHRSTLRPWLEMSPGGRRVLDAFLWEHLLRPEWNQAFAELQHSSLESAINYLQHRTEGSRQISVLGVDVSSITVRWSMWLVTTMLLLYITATLREIKLLADIADSSWIGLYTNWIAQILTAISLLIAPLIANYMYLAASRGFDNVGLVFLAMHPSILVDMLPWSSSGVKFYFSADLVQIVVLTGLLTVCGREWRRVRNCHRYHSRRNLTVIVSSRRYVP